MRGVISVHDAENNHNNYNTLMEGLTGSSLSLLQTNTLVPTLPVAPFLVCLVGSV